MGQMLYKLGGDTKVWNTKAHVIVVDEADVDEYLADGWLDHPSKLLLPTETETETETAKPVRTKKAKVPTDESND